MLLFCLSYPTWFVAALCLLPFTWVNRGWRKCGPCCLPPPCLWLLEQPPSTPCHSRSFPFSRLLLYHITLPSHQFRLLSRSFSPRLPFTLSLVYTLFDQVGNPLLYQSSATATSHRRHSSPRIRLCWFRKGECCGLVSSRPSTHGDTAPRVLKPKSGRRQTASTPAQLRFSKRIQRWTHPLHHLLSQARRSFLPWSLKTSF